MLRTRERLVPPRGLIFTGAGDFKDVGNKFKEKIVVECRFSPGGRLLDIGCGIGRIARPFTAYLNPSGAYYGFDIVDDGIKWCRQHYQSFPNFHFHHAELRNDLYNLHTPQLASEFVFPYHDESFDAICAISVFTHMQEQDVKHYFSEISRVLKPGKSGVCTFFVITEERLAKNTRNINIFFKYNYGDFYLHDNRVKDANVAYRIEALEKMAGEAGLIISKFIPGWWAGYNRTNKFDFQDVIVLTKTD